RHVSALHALGLESEHHDDVAVLEAAAHVVEDLDAQTLDRAGHQSRRSNHAYARTHRGQKVNVRPGDTAMEDVATDGNQEPREPAASTPNRQRIEQRLGRMFVAAVAAVDHRAVHLLGEQIDSARVGVANDQHVRMHGIECHRRIDQRLALLDGARRRLHVDNVATQAFSGQFEGRTRAGRVLEKEIDKRATRQQVVLLFRTAIEGDIGLGEIEKGADLLPREPLDAKKMAMTKSKAGGSAHRRRLITGDPTEWKRWPLPGSFNPYRSHAGAELPKHAPAQLSPGAAPRPSDHPTVAQVRDAGAIHVENLFQNL